MSLLKPTITGLNAGHALAGNLTALWDVGGADKDWVSDTALTTSAPTVTDADLGDCRVFDGTAAGFGQTVAFGTGYTVVFIYKNTFLHESGADAAALLDSTDVYNAFDLKTICSSYLSNDFYLDIRSNSSPKKGTATSAFANQEEYEGAHAVSVTNPVAASPTFVVDGAIPALTVDEGGAPSSFANNPVAHNVLPTSSFTGDESVTLAGVLVFDKILSNAEAQSITTDPWALVEGIFPPSISLGASTYSPGGTISGSYANFVGVPTGPLALADNNNNVLNVAVTISDNGDGTGTFIGTMPTLPAQGASTAGLLFGSVTAELTDPGA